MLTSDQRNLLKPFGEQLCNWEIRVAEMSDGEVADLEEACNAATGTNVWYCIYDAAQIIKRIIKTRRALSVRARA